MKIKTYNSNIEIFFDDERSSIILYSDDYFNSDSLPTEAEARESLPERYVLTEEEIDKIIDTLYTREWITNNPAVDHAQ